MTLTMGALWLRRGVIAVVLCGAFAGLLIVRIHMAADSAMRRSDQAFNHGSLQVALSEAHQAALWYLPFSSNERQSYDRLRAIAVGAEAAGRARLAQQAWEAIRGALLETAHPVPFGETQRTKLLDEANVQLARLLAQPELGAQPDLQAELLASYRAPLTPKPERVLGHSVGMLLILLTGLGLVFAQRTPGVRRALCVPLSLGVLLWFFSALGA